MRKKDTVQRGPLKSERAAVPANTGPTPAEHVGVKTPSVASPLPTSDAIPASPPPQRRRSSEFSRLPHGRFWWHKWPNADFVPPIYSFLEDEEWSLLEMWFKETETFLFIGESGIPFMSTLQGLIMGNRLRRTVQLGTYSGYSSLLIGFMLRRMRIKAGLFSSDIDQTTTDFANKYVRLAGLDDYVKLVVGDSREPALVTRVMDYFGGLRPQLVIIDSSHERDQTLVELDLWYDALQPGGFMVLHDTSAFAQQWDRTRNGGVKVAFDEWTARNSDVACINIDCAASLDPASPNFVYQDGNGIGIIYKRKDRPPP
jgi:predicted O-methyltransferase YrrM